MRLPKSITEQKDLREGHGVSVELKNGQIVIERILDDVSLESLLQGVSKENVHRETDWSNPRGNEIW